MPDFLSPVKVETALCQAYFEPLISLCMCSGPSMLTVMTKVTLSCLAMFYAVAIIFSVNCQFVGKCKIARF